MKKLFSLSFLLIITIVSFGQNKNYCERSWCKLPANDKAHFDPYYNGHLCENFNPKQVDFSQEYLKLQINRTLKYSKDITPSLAEYEFNLDSIFNTGNNQQNGIIGFDYNRIKIHISSTKIDSTEHFTYIITGKSNVNGNICNFRGRVKIIKVYKVTDEIEYPGQGVLFASYELLEDRNEKNAGVFKGTYECSINIDDHTKSIRLDKSNDIADGYHNRTYIGTWTDYKSNKSKKCIWGDYRLPFTFDFDCGDGEMRACEKYEKNGWTSFNQNNEFKESNGVYILKDQWWIKK